MSEPKPESSYSTDARPRAGCLILLLPVGLTILIMVAYAMLFTLGMVGSSASGDRVTVTFSTCPEAKPLIEKRVDMMGLGQPQWSGSETQPVLTATLPATPAAFGIPATLARTGRFSIRRGRDLSGEVILDQDDLETAEFSTKELGNPLVVLKLQRASQQRLEQWMEDNNDASITVWIDDESILTRPADPPFRREEIDIRSEGPDGFDNLTRAVNWAMIMTHGPLPCEATIDSVSGLSSPVQD